MATANQPQEQNLFRRYWWLLLIVLFLCALCLGIWIAAGPGLVSRVLATQPASESATSVSTEPPPGALTEPGITIPTDSPTATAGSESATPTATDTSTPTATVTLTRAAPAVTCKCQGRDLVCSNGATTRNSPKCPTPIPPANTAAPAACTAGWRPASGCSCCGNDLWCADGSIGVFNPKCACRCDGTTLVCVDGGKKPNATECGYKP